MQSITEKIIEQLVYPNWIPNHPDHPPFTIQQKYDLYRYIGDLDKEDEWWVYWYMGESDTMNYFEDEWDQLVEDNEFKEDKEWIPLSREERWELEFGYDSMDFDCNEYDARFEWDIDFHEDEINFQ